MRPKGKKPEATLLTLEVATSQASWKSPAGIPLQPLANLEGLRVATGAETIHSAASALASNAIAWPSVLTAGFLDEAVRAWPTVPDESVPPDPGHWLEHPTAWRKIWLAEEDARELYASLRDSGALVVLLQKPAVFWNSWQNQNWMIVPCSVSSPNGGGSEAGLVIQAVPEVLVEIGLLELLDQSRLRIPTYAGVSFDFMGRSFPESMTGRVLGEARTDWKWRASTKGHYLDAGTVLMPELAVNIRLENPAALFSQERRRAFWFGGLILAALFAALAGWFTARRAFYRQLRLSEMKSNFVSSVSHELRAPIASVRLMAEGLERGKIQAPEKQREYFRFITQECRRLSSLIENVLDFSRIEQGRKQYDMEPTDLAALAEQTVRLMEPCAAEQQISLSLTVNGEAAPVELDGKAIQQALINLIDNAIKHSSKGADVSVGLEFGRASAGAASEGVRLWVEDKGEGIPASEHERIFERFYRIGSELRRQTQGVGIGLSIVKHIVEAHGGRVTVRSAIGEGSRFTIELPQLERDGNKKEARI